MNLANQGNLPISYFYIVQYWLYSKFTNFSSANLLRKAIRQTKVPPNFRLLQYYKSHTGTTTHVVACKCVGADCSSCNSISARQYSCKVVLFKFMFELMHNPGGFQNLSYTWPWFSCHALLHTSVNNNHGFMASTSN